MAYAKIKILDKSNGPKLLVAASVILHSRKTPKLFWVFNDAHTDQ